MNSQSMHPDWLIPEWPAAANVRAFCTTRHGGVSLAPWDALNLGGHVGDAPAQVMRNRAITQECLPGAPTYLNQVHGTQMLQLPVAQDQTWSADGVFTLARSTVCCIMVADCLPILLTNRAGTMIAAVHAGWRGLAGTQGVGVVENIVAEFGRHQTYTNGDSDNQIMAWLGPCIGPYAFEVGHDVCVAFTDGDPAASEHFEPHGDGKWLANLAGLARQRLAASGVFNVYGNDSTAQWCTHGNPSRFFSHRRDRVSGRQAAFIWLD
jgi:YfiH family protein